jgi:membrane protein
MTLGPLVLGMSLTVTSYAISASKGVVGVMPGGVQLLLDSIQFLLMAGGMAAIYRYVPNTQVKWSHAGVGGLFVSAGFEVAKIILAMYLAKVPTYSVVYGAFATLPILLIWIYVAWVIVLLGAVITAYLPSLLAGLERRERSHGMQFQLALEVLQWLDQERVAEKRGLTMTALSAHLRVDSLQLEPVLETLCALDWVGLLDEASDLEEARYVLLANPDTTPLAPLLHALLLPEVNATKNLRKTSLWTTTTVREAL